MACNGMAKRLRGFFQRKTRPRLCENEVSYAVVAWPACRIPRGTCKREQVVDSDRVLPRGSKPKKAESGLSLRWLSLWTLPG